MSIPQKQQRTTTPLGEKKERQKNIRVILVFSSPSTSQQRHDTGKIGFHDALVSVASLPAYQPDQQRPPPEYALSQTCLLQAQFGASESQHVSSYFTLFLPLGLRTENSLILGVV